MSNQQAIQRMRAYLWDAIDQGTLNDRPELQRTILMALRSPDQEWVAKMFPWIQIQSLGGDNGDDPPPPRIFPEPRPAAARERALC